MVLDVQRQEVALNLNSDWGFKFGPVNTLKGFGDAHLTVLTVKGDEGLRFGGLNKRFREYYRLTGSYSAVTEGLPTIHEGTTDFGGVRRLLFHEPITPVRVVVDPVLLL